MPYIFCEHPGLDGLHISGRSWVVPSILATHGYFEVDGDKSMIDYAKGNDLWGANCNLKLGRCGFDTNVAFILSKLTCLFGISVYCSFILLCLLFGWFVEAAPVARIAQHCTTMHNPITQNSRMYFRGHPSKEHLLTKQ